MTTRMNCERLETLLGERLQNTLAAELVVEMDVHIGGCVECQAMLAEFEHIVSGARALPPLTPSRDLWPAIESRLGPQLLPDNEVAPVESPHDTGASNTSIPRSAKYSDRRSSNWQVLAAAAVLLVAMSSAVTWQIARSVNGAIAVPNVASVSAPEATSPAVPAGNATAPAALTPSTASSNTATNLEVVGEKPLDWEALSAQYVANSDMEVEAIYEREIAALRVIVDERLGDLDSTTVAELERNLDIIDRAIRDSHEALRRDPRSALLSHQLDRALAHKLDLLRRIAVL